MILTEKSIQQLVKKLAGKSVATRKPSVGTNDKQIDISIKSTAADEIFREMKKLPYTE